MDAAARAVLQALALGALASSTSLRPARIAVDRFDGSHWTRAAYIEVALPWQAHAGGTAYIPLVCLPSWGNLIDRWPKSDALDLALGYFAESVADWHDGRLQRSLLSAAIATEVLFSDSASELSHRMSLRGAHLVATGQPAIAVQARLKRLYAVRSGVVHSGKPVTAQSCRDWHMFLMAALPRAAAHGGDMPRLRKELDQANFLRSEGLRALDDPAAWWSFCDFAGFASAGGA